MTQKSRKPNGQGHTYKNGLSYRTVIQHNGHTVTASAKTIQESKRLAKEKAPVLVNLASEEYFKAVDLKTLNARIVQCVFQDGKNDVYKVVSFHAKRARGLMARFAIEQRVSKPEDLKKFNSEGYAYIASLSTDDKLVFRRAS